jgi:hypothetical protein
MSEVITILIVVSLALVAVGIVWYIIQGVISQGGEEVDTALSNVRVAPKSCLEILSRGFSSKDGIHTIDPTGSGQKLKVYCDMITDGGGWTLIFSSQTVGGRADQTGPYNNNLQTLTPGGSMLSVWTPFESVNEIRFACDGDKTGALEYDGLYTGNEIYSQIRESNDGLGNLAYTLDDSKIYGGAGFGDVGSHPDFGITDNSWGTFDDYPLFMPSAWDRCGGGGYQTRENIYPTEATTSNAYFYVFVR